MGLDGDDENDDESSSTATAMGIYWIDSIVKSMKSNRLEEVWWDAATAVHWEESTELVARSII